MRDRPHIAAIVTVPRVRLWAEFVALFCGVPVLMAAFFGQYPLLPVVLSLAVIALVLLALTPGFTLRELVRGPVAGEWRIVAGFTVLTGVVAVGAVHLLVPERFLEMPTYRPGLWLMILLLYPFLSALPQELIFRPLFFRRYGALFPTSAVAIAANGAVFGLGHLFYMNWVTIGLTAAGGAVMGWAYLRHGSLLLAWVLHSAAGQIIFTAGLGIFFYHGAVAH